jgi:hypothetical protein
MEGKWIPLEGAKRQSGPDLMNDSPLAKLPDFR